MTIEIFLLLLVAGSTVASLLTETIKKFEQNKGVHTKNNIIALILAVVIGGIGTVSYYLIEGIPFNVVNILGILGMIVANWIGAMIGYDKVIQTIQQIGAKNEVGETK